MSTPNPSPGILDRLIAASARNSVLVVLLAGLGIFLGILSLQRIPLDALPDLSDTQVIVMTEWEGRSPDLIEDQITYPISSQFISAPKVKAVRAESMFGKSFVYVIFEDGTDLYWARTRVSELLAGVRSKLPEGVAPSMGPDATGVGWIFQYALVDESGKHSLPELRAFQDWNLRYALSAVKGVAEVATVGGFVKEYQVNLDPNKMSAHGVTMTEVIEKLRMSNGDAAGKVLEIGATEFYVRGRGYIHTLKEIEEVPLKSVRGVPVQIKHVGTVELGPGMRRGVAELDGRGETVGGIIVMRHGESALNVIREVKAKLKAIEPSLPSGMKVVVTYDRSELILAAINTLRIKLIEESIVVAGVCLLFLWHVRSALVAIITLPIAILLSFIPMAGLNLTSNLMSLGGIAIAIGAMVDAAIIMVENAHKALEHHRDVTGHDPVGKERVDILIAAAQSVGRPLFFSLLVITVSFLPVFSLTAQEGRLFRPLAFTKTFSMFFACLLSITLAPALMVWFIRGRITPEAKNPINRFLLWIYQPMVKVVLHHPKTVLFLGLILLGITVYPYSKLGKEFMPPLNEGTILFMPTSAPGISIGEATRILSLQDRLFKEFPEVDHVFGKAGEAETATDPAPLSMFETVVTLKPRSQWRAGMTWDKLVEEMNEKLKTPGMANVFQMPIQTRTEMLSTGLRSILGIKLYGPSNELIEAAGRQIEKTLSAMPETRSAFAERIGGGSYLDITPNRETAARHGLTSGDVNDLIETAIGGRTVSTILEGRQRFPLSVRYARNFRDDLEAMKRSLVPINITTGGGAAMSGGAESGPQKSGQIPLGMLANFEFKKGPSSIRTENGQLAGLVFVDISTDNLEGYVSKASAAIQANVTFPAGVYYRWDGQFEHLRTAEERLVVVIPLTLVIISLLIYFNTKSIVRTSLVLLAVPFSLIGAFWLLYLLGYNLSVAVWVGIIALAGLDAETGVIMLLYLDQAFDERKAKGLLHTREDLIQGIVEGAAHRIRPKVMTICAILLGLLPILWSPDTQTGADVMKRIAAPMVGGIITSGVLELLLYPSIYLLWRKRHLPAPSVV